VAYFSFRKKPCQRTTFTTHFTTMKPSKNHVLHAVFSKTPAKAPIHHRKKITQKKKAGIAPGLRGDVSSN
jgi:hypothetical protein